MYLMLSLHCSVFCTVLLHWLQPIVCQNNKGNLKRSYRMKSEKNLKKRFEIQLRHVYFLNLLSAEGGVY